MSGATTGSLGLGPVPVPVRDRPLSADAWPLPHAPSLRAGPAMPSLRGRGARRWRYDSAKIAPRCEGLRGLLAPYVVGCERRVREG